MNNYDIPEAELHYSHEAECGVLSAVFMIGPEAYDATAVFITGDAFCEPLHKLLWQGCEKLILEGKYCDIVTLMERMRGIEVDWVYVNQMTQAHTSIRMAKQHAQIIAKYAKERSLKAASFKVKELAEDTSMEVEERVAQSVVALEDVVSEKHHSEPKAIAEFAASFIDHLTDLADGNIVPGRPTNIPALDYMLSGGLRDEQLVIVAARPSVGKSSFAQQLALSAARDGVASAFFGMEMTSRELTNRTVANIGRVSLTGLKTGKMDNEEWARVTEGVEALRSLPLFLHDEPSMTLAHISSKARALVRRSNVKLLVIDYLQLMKGSNGKSERRTQLEEITRGLKQLAKQLRITVILLSQLNRAVEQRSNPRPIMSDLKECGAIEEDADLIFALWNHKKSTDGGADIKGLACLKNRDGITGEMALHFEGKYQKWSESTESLAENFKTNSPAKRYTNEF